MIPKITPRGHSFKGLVTYLMHDPNRAETSERVAWHHCGNMLTQDPMTAAKVMAYTDMSREDLKEAAGISTAGRKQTAGAVFHYTLAWEHGNTPEKDHMQSCVTETLRLLGLEKHEHVTVAHDDTDHAHVHIVANLTNPQNGVRHDVGLSKRKLQGWALEYERKHGLKCSAREENAQKRERGETVKYQDETRDYKQAVTQAFEQSDNGAAFRQALKEQGLELAIGNRGKFVIVDDKGNIDALTRNLDIAAKGKAKTAAMTAKFADMNRDDIAQAEEIARQIKNRAHAEDEKHSPDKIIDRVEKHHAAFTRKDVERELYRHIPDHKQRKEAIDAVLEHKGLKTIGDKDGKAVYATEKMIALERDMIRAAQKMAVQGGYGVEERHRKAAIEAFNADLAAKTDGKASLTAQQKQAIDHITQDNRLSNMIGIAGAGKSTILSAAKDMWEAQGYRVRGAALSGIAAQGLQENGIDAQTLHAMEGRARVADEIMQQRQGQALTEKQAALVKAATFTDKDILVIDEAGMVSAAQLKRVLDLAERSGAKLVMAGDHDQLQSIEAGAAFRTIVERTGAAELDEVRRQKEDWQKQATRDFATGQAQTGLRAYDEKGCVTSCADHATARETLVRDMMQSYDENADKSRLVMAYTRKDVAALNHDIRQQMIEKGVVQSQSHEANILMTDGEGDYQEKTAFGIGDRLMFRANDKKMEVMNGTLGTIKAIDNGNFTVTLDNKRDVTFNNAEYQKFQHGYAATVHKAQGVTVDEAYIMGNRNFDRHTTYVAMSRHKETARLYTSETDFSDKEKMFRSLSCEGASLSTLDFEDNKPKQKEQPPQHPEDTQNPPILTPETEIPFMAPKQKQPSLVPEEVIIRNELTGQPNRNHMSSAERWEMEGISRLSEPYRSDSPRTLTTEQLEAFRESMLQNARDRMDMIDALTQPNVPTQAQDAPQTMPTIEKTPTDRQGDINTVHAPEHKEAYTPPEMGNDFHEQAFDTYADVREELQDLKATRGQESPVLEQEILQNNSGDTIKIYSTKAREDEINALESTLDTRMLSPEHAAREQFQDALRQEQEETQQETQDTGLDYDPEDIDLPSYTPEYEEDTEEEEQTHTMDLGYDPEQIGQDYTPDMTAEDYTADIMQQHSETESYSESETQSYSYSHD